MTVIDVPSRWYNLLADLDFELPVDLPAPGGAGRRGSPSRVPLSLVRQESGATRWPAIPDEIRNLYAQWRPTPLRRASSFERLLGTRSRLYYKYEGGNLSGSHKLNTAMAQAYYYRAAGVTRLTVGTGAGQWGTAVAHACRTFGLECTVYMVQASYRAKPYRRLMMELLGATVVESPSDRTPAGRRAAAQLGPDGSLSVALAEAVEDADANGGSFCTGSGETYSLLHQTVIGLEAQGQLREFDDAADVLVASLGGGSNLGGLATPFLGAALRGGRACRVIAVEPTACPKLTRGRYAYDFTDASRRTPLQKMYTLGHIFAPPRIHAGGLRYHASAKLISSLYHRGLVEAAAYGQREVLASALDFATAEGVLPAPESAYAVHGAAVEAARCDAAGRPACIVIGLSGHGMFDLATYDAYRAGDLSDSAAGEEQIAESLRQLPPQPADVSPAVVA